MVSQLDINAYIYQQVFRARLRQFPALVNCCTIDWFSEWPQEALESVAMTFLQEMPDLEASDEIVGGLMRICQEMHQTVAMESLRYVASPLRLTRDWCSSISCQLLS